MCIEYLYLYGCVYIYILSDQGEVEVGDENIFPVLGLKMSIIISLHPSFHMFYLMCLIDYFI